jgi:plasmid stability protein
MATITLKNIPDSLYDQIKQSAEANRRSINSEIITCIEKALSGRKVNTDKILTAARALRKKASDHVFRERDITKIKNSGRP